MTFSKNINTNRFPEPTSPEKNKMISVESGKKHVGGGKYIVFKRDDFIQLMAELALPPYQAIPHGMIAGETWDSAPIAEYVMQRVAETMIKDGVVIRRQDVFAPPALDAYANSIATTIEALRATMPGEDGRVIIKQLTDVADYFHSQAKEAWETNRKMPD